MIVCRSQAEIAKLRRVNQLVGRILAELRAVVTPGVTTADIDAKARRGSQLGTSERVTQACSVDSKSSSTDASLRIARARNTAVTAFAGGEW